MRRRLQAAVFACTLPATLWPLASELGICPAKASGSLEAQLLEDFELGCSKRLFGDHRPSQLLRAPADERTTAVRQIRRKSALGPECQATKGPREDPDFLQRVRPCGNLSALCTDLHLVEANKDYPGGGLGAVVPDQDYIVQFDVGLHPGVAKEILHQRLREFETCVHCPAIEESFGEQCFEVIITGGAMWGDLGIPSVVKPHAYDCMGGCGRGCSGVFFGFHSEEDVGGLDCLKHDLCSAWKSVFTGRATKGFCHDPDCGDEAAMTIYNCWRGWRLFGSLGGARHGPLAEPTSCDPQDDKVRGCWNHGGWFTPGRCKLFQGWDKGQGIPDPHPLRSLIQRL